MSERKIHIGGTIWTYRIYKWNVVIRNPDRKSTVVSFDSLLTGMSGNDIERAAHKRYLHITPALVKAYIERLIA